MSIIFYCGAIIFICIAHFIRVIRWELFIEVYEKPNRRRLIQSLSYGYLLNYIIPYKMGDILRAWISGKGMKNGKSLSFSSVIMDRFLDIIAVGIIFCVLSISGISGEITKKTAEFYAIFAVAFIACILLIYLFRNFFKKIIKAVAGIFNDEIESDILQFAWALIWNFKDIYQKISKIKIIILTLGMWGGYLLSYFLFAAFLQATGTEAAWTDVFIMLFTQNGIAESTGTLTLAQNETLIMHPFAMICYMVLPLLIMLAISLVIPKKKVENDEDYLRLLPHQDPEERLKFLENYFSNVNREYVINYLKINQGVSIIRDYSAGSNATTMLCADRERTFFRKYAFDEDGDKLYQQILWIVENRKYLKLPEILRKEKTELYCYYDMPYNGNSIGLFEYVHSMPIEEGWKMIQNVLESLEHSIYQLNVRKADRETIHRYIEGKVYKNLNKIKTAKKIRSLQQYDKVYINGIPYNNLAYYEKYLKEDCLQDIFKNDMYSVIHGDLTIENVICMRYESGKDDFYIIDPNTGNIHDSSNLDYGKLLQSIHGGYEFLMSTKDVAVNENHINFLFTRSSAYMELHQKLKSYMKENLGEERTRSIYFHEIIHWLRLMPYKIEKDGKRALLFYSGLLMVLNDVISMYGEE